VTLSDVVQDTRYALRKLRQNPVVTGVAIASLALGIGANTAIFTLVDALLLRSLPVPNPSQLVILAFNPQRHNTSFNYPDYRYLRDHSQSYSGLLTVSNGGRAVGFKLPSQEGPSQLTAVSLVSGNYFQVLGVQPAAGRLFNAADEGQEGASPYAVLSYAFWQKALGGDPASVGRDILLNGRRFQVVGIARQGFHGTSVGITPDIYLPIVMYRSLSPAASSWNTRHQWWLTVMGRLKPGVPVKKAEAEFDVLWHRILDADPEKRPPAAWDKQYKLDNTAIVLPGAIGNSWMRRDVEKPLTILQIVTGLVLLIACANVANLLLARAVARRREIAVRLAVGAGRGRLITQLLTESLMLGILGGLAGLAIAWLGVDLLLQFFPREVFALDLHLSPDARVLGFAFTLSVLTGLLFGFAPALRASRPELTSALKAGAGASDGGRVSRLDLRRGLVALQVALSMLLLAGSGLFVKTLANLRAVDLGLQVERLLFVSNNVHQLGYQPQKERQFDERLRDEAMKLPGVRAVSLAAVAPLGQSRWNEDVQVEGYTWKPDEPPYMDINLVSPRFFEAAGIPVLLGRDFQESDNTPQLPERSTKPRAPTEPEPNVPGPQRTVIVNEAFVRKMFPAQSPIGKRLCIGEKWVPEKVAYIVGVVKDTQYFDPRKPVEPMIYQPRYREQGGDSTLVLRSTGDPKVLVESIRRKAQEIDGAVSILESRTMEDNVDRAFVAERTVATLGGFFGVLALLLAAIGLYGVMAQAVTRRTREIGIRVALGAEARMVMTMVLRDALWMVLTGAVVGIPAALILTRAAQSLLFGVQPHDPGTLAAAAGILLLVTAAAVLLPARRATRVDPMIALRDE
jgi:predicted permease